MRNTVLVWLVLCATDVWAQDTKIEEIGKSPVEVSFSAGGRIRMDLCSSGIDVVGKDEGKVRVSYDTGRSDVKVRIQVTGDTADLAVSRCPRNDFRLTIEVPKTSALRARMFAGQLNVDGVTGDKDLQLDFGQMNLDIGKAEDYAKVTASVNSGDLEARPFHVSKGGLFRSFEQKGPGKYRLHAHVGAGQLEMN